MIARCANAACPWHGDPKAMTLELLPGEVVVCGSCGQACDLTDDEAPGDG
jgi:hypothetical protein